MIVNVYYKSKYIIVYIYIRIQSYTVLHYLCAIRCTYAWNAATCCQAQENRGQRFGYVLTVQPAINGIMS